MAESVDALVSNTSGFTSIPVRPRVWVQGESSKGFLLFFMLFFVDIGNDGIFVSYFLTEKYHEKLDSSMYCHLFGVFVDAG